MMACVQPIPLRDDDLLAYLAGEATPAVTAHLAQCDDCHQRLAALAAAERQMSQLFYRRECPSALTLGEYQLGLLSPTLERPIAAHLRQCPHCTNEMALLTSYLTAVAPTIAIEPVPALGERMRVWVARLVEELSTLGAPGELTAAAAGLRGAAADQHRVYEADAGVQLILDVQADGQRPGQRLLLGLVLGLVHPETLTAHLWRADRSGAATTSTPVATTTIDELGNFILSNLAPGSYALILRSEKTEVHIPDLSL
ncbi:MAG: hypothetical protein KF832_19790 [Caldilineaceae bacterium]|nr:hypothetical protein [Caldilineaceae bacterium]